MRVYHFTNSNHGLAAIRDQRLKAARIHELNDPFEFLGVDLSDQTRRRVLTETKREISKTKGILCFCRSWRHPLLWAHYVDKHRGLCLEFEVDDTLIDQVRYVNSRFSRETEELSEDLMRKLILTKFAHWSYEDEYRAFVDLKTPENGLYFVSFGKALTLKRVLVGHECILSRADLAMDCGEIDGNIERFKVRPAFRTFRMVRQKRDRMWA